VPFYRQDMIMWLPAQMGAHHTDAIFMGRTMSDSHAPDYQPVIADAA